MVYAKAALNAASTFIKAMPCLAGEVCYLANSPNFLKVSYWPLTNGHGGLLWVKSSHLRGTAV